MSEMICEDLKDKEVLITGYGSGTGVATAILLADLLPSIATCIRKYNYNSTDPERSV
jgi:hypothetical protein